MSELKPERFDAQIKINPGARRPNWHESLSPYGYILGEVVSAMGKEIRRGNEFEAAYWAHQLAISGSQAEAFLWERLRMISVEDIGLASIDLITVVSDLKDLYFSLPEYHEDRFTVATHAVVCLSRQPKCRMSLEMYLAMSQQLRRDELRLDVPDYAIDFHTRRGKAMGRGAYHYLTEGSVLGEGRDHNTTEYREYLLRLTRDAER